MKTLVITRHAKSDWHLNLPDFERSLNSRGIKDALEMATRLKNTDFVADALVHSSALRTTQTAKFFKEILKIDSLFSEPSIYEAAVEDLIECVSLTDAKINCLLLVGHNPGVSELIYFYTEQMLDMVTCAMAYIEFNVDDWSQLSRNSGQLRWFDFPKKVKGNYYL